MILTEALRASPALLVAACGLLGLIVGSFLNVVSLRLPRMLHAQAECECREILALPPEPPEPPARLSLLYPPSTCPACGSRIKPWHNVPVLGWLWLRGRCAACRAPISLQYPAVELAAGLAGAVCAWRFGFGLQLAAALPLSWALLALAVIDVREQLLPDDITLPLVWAGLALSCLGVFAADPPASIAGALAGYLSLWSIYHAFRLLTGKKGMGYGDFKLLMALGAWLGIRALPAVVLLSSAAGAVVGIGLILLRGHGRDTPIPFGPFLAGAGWLTLVAGKALIL
ncbi:MAG: prepilin peptidase [Nevskia sp.]|nr:prepilin peptidase [Nevskia sp.]